MTHVLMSRIVKRVIFPENCSAVSLEIRRGASIGTSISVKIILESDYLIDLGLLRIILH
jgi:hypothetical protein